MKQARGPGTEEPKITGEEIRKNLESAGYKVSSIKLPPIDPRTKARLQEKANKYRKAIEQSRESFENSEQKWGNPLPGEPGWDEYLRMICG